MITPIDEASLVSRASCTEDEAVAKLLGWMRSLWRLPNLSLTEDGIDLAQLPLMLALPCALDQFITDEREFASIRLHNAVGDGDPAAIQKWEGKVTFWKQAGEKVVHYRLELQQELRRPASKLECDELLTQQTGIRHITLASLDLWARRTLGISILEDEPSAPVIPQERTKRPRIKLQQQQAAILEHIRQLGHDPLNLPPSQPTTPGVKSAVRAALIRTSDLFPSDRRFDKVWEELRGTKQIIDQQS